MKRIVITLMSIMLFVLAFGQETYKGDGSRLSPRLLNYQGFMTDTLSNPLSGAYDILFRIYDDSLAGNLLWSENQFSVPIAKGIFHVVLGSVTALPDSIFSKGANRWLSLRISSQDLSPRTRIVSSPYSVTATLSDTALYARNSAPDNDWIRSTGKVYTYNLTDSVGIRTATPRYPLDVNGVICGGSDDTVKATYGGILSGYSNLAGDVEADSGAMVCGGINNACISKFAYIGGGYENNIDGNGLAATIGGGRGNIATGSAATVSGGAYNVGNGAWVTIAGGGENSAVNCASVTGGYGNAASGSWSAVGGGSYNEASANYSTVAGGQDMHAKAVHGGALSGRNNHAGDSLIDTAAVVSGGANNNALAAYSTIGGGKQNSASGTYSAILGGYANTIATTGSYSYLFGINSNLTQDSTFMVDMPHVWFGTAAAGYEFPRSRGTNGQVMVTNGSGILSWGGITYVDSARVAANSHKLQGKDTTALDARYVNEGQSAGGDLSGTYPSPTIANNAVNSDKIQDGSITAMDIRDTTITTAKIKDGAVTMAKINQAGAATGQVIKWNGSAWQPAADSFRDNDWTFRITDTADTTLQLGSRWGITRPGNTLNGNADSTHVNLGIASQTGYLGLNDKYCTIAGGQGNIAERIASTVGGGQGNNAGGEYSTIGGGYSNIALWIGSLVAGGYDNYAYQAFATVCGGDSNTANQRSAVVAGGRGDTASAVCATVVGGSSNLASGSGAFVGGGYDNTASGTNATVSGGDYNTAIGSNAAIAGGSDNYCPGGSATISGGSADTARGDFSSIGGGSRNNVDALYGGIGSGRNNVAGDSLIDTAAVIAGGRNNSATSFFTSIVGGSDNLADVGYATVVGGQNNHAGDYWTAVGGGALNYAGNNYATVPGGRADTAAGLYSFAANDNSYAGFSNSTALNGQVTTATGQTRIGTLSKAGGTFTIDHPLDPENKILNHYFVESPDMSNMYSGSAVLDAAGRAQVELPDYFDALNKDPRVQLTGVGSSDVYVAEDIRDNRFAIGGKPGMKVYWTVIADRKDQSAEIIRNLMPVEQPKTGALAGRSLDDDFLVVTKGQLEEMGKAGGFKFRHAAEESRYEDTKKEGR